jgi:hypothetical protein
MTMLYVLTDHLTVERAPTARCILAAAPDEAASAPRSSACARSGPRRRANDA